MLVSKFKISESESVVVRSFMVSKLATSGVSYRQYQKYQQYRRDIILYIVNHVPQNQICYILVRLIFKILISMLLVCSAYEKNRTTLDLLLYQIFNCFECFRVLMPYRCYGRKKFSVFVSTYVCGCVMNLFHITRPTGQDNYRCTKLSLTSLT